MKYQDTDTTVNGFVVGLKVGTPIQDAIEPEADGYDHLRDHTTRKGTMIQDVEGEQPIPVEE